MVVGIGNGKIQLLVNRLMAKWSECLNSLPDDKFNTLPN